MQVEQTSQRAIINYQDFNIAADETVNFNQPNAQAVVLNRVVGGNLAEIYGHMNANGQVYLVNPNGVLIGQGAELNVGGLMVTSLDMRQADFLAGREQLEGPAAGGWKTRAISMLSKRLFWWRRRSLTAAVFKRLKVRWR